MSYRGKYLSRGQLLERLENVAQINRVFDSYLQLVDEHEELKQKYASLELELEDAQYTIGECTCGEYIYK